MFKKLVNVLKYSNSIREFVTLKTLVAGWLGTQVLLDVVIAGDSAYSSADN